jgi:hypothetical protein
MTQSAQDVLAQIPRLVDAQDAAALAGLSEHSDKAIRKAARKAVHTLRSRGVVIPEGPTKSWTPGALTEGDTAAAAAMLDVASAPAITRLLVAFPVADGRGQLWVAALTAFDQVVGFNAYAQTDGQRGRVLRDWDRQAGGRSVPVEWARARIRWAREQTLRLGVSAPTALNDALIHLGDAPPARPTSFLSDFVDERDPAAVDRLLLAVGAPSWPPLLAVEPFLKRVTEANPNMTQETPESERASALLAAVDGDLELRGALQGPIANLLEDAAIGLWLASNDELSRGVSGLARQLRGDAPEALPWIPRLLGLQIAATMNAMNQQQRRSAG